MNNTCHNDTLLVFSFSSPHYLLRQQRCSKEVQGVSILCVLDRQRKHLQNKYWANVDVYFMYVPNDLTWGMCARCWQGVVLVKSPATQEVQNRHQGDWSRQILTARRPGSGGVRSNSSEAVTSARKHKPWQLKHLLRCSPRNYEIKLFRDPATKWQFFFSNVLTKRAGAPEWFHGGRGERWNNVVASNWSRSWYLSHMLIVFATCLVKLQFIEKVLPEECYLYEMNSSLN